MASDRGHRKALLRARALMCKHPAVSDVEDLSLHEANGTTTVDVVFNVNLPSEWKPCGESPLGVRQKEVVRFDFPSNFPLYPPGLSLRTDFPRNLPHIQPYLTEGRPVPCIYDGSLDELLHEGGLAAILDQTAVWLERAASDTLIDPEQGWEPVRRDSLKDYLVADADGLRQLVNRRGGHSFHELRYLKMGGNGHSEFIHGQISVNTLKVNRAAVANLFGEGQGDRTSCLSHGKSLALVVRPDKGEQAICDIYLPETVSSVDDLKERAAQYGCANGLNAGLNWLKQCLSKYRQAGPFPLAIILLARRPFNVIGSQSPVELCPYIMNICFPDLFPNSSATAVRPAGHRHAITRPLLAQMSGGAATSKRPRWTLIGAGSLGSKLALHLARAGQGPEVVLDKSTMMPHNAARHALIPAPGDMQLLWADAKARGLCESLRGLNQKATPIMKNAVKVLTSKALAKRAWSKRSWAVVNATASLAVREALAATRLMPTRVVETSLFAGGRVGMITTEGPGRNPNTADLIAEYYALLREDSAVAPIVFDGAETVSRQSIGQGCGSLTMVMSDGQLSLFAAAMAQYLLTRQREGLSPDGGEVLIGRLSEDGCGLTWRPHKIPPVTVVPTTNSASWRIHVHARAVAKIRKAATRWAKVETGGVLMGRVSEASQVAHIVDVLDAPEDSKRSASGFILGTKGLRQQMKTYSEAVGWSLYCLGTWHSHLSASGPSGTDQATARAVSLARLTPSVLLIWAPADFHAILADSADARPEGD